MKKTVLNVTIDPVIKAQVANIAKEKNRSVSNLVETILKNYLERRNESPAAKYFES